MYNLKATCRESVTVYTDLINHWDWIIQPYLYNESRTHVMVTASGEVLESLGGLFATRGEAINHMEQHLAIA